MSLFADLIMREYSDQFAMKAMNAELSPDCEGTDRIEEMHAIDGADLYLEEDGSIGHGAYEQGRGVKIIEQDYDGEAMTWYGHEHWDDC